ncbi:molybdopterin converting factor small subunit [Allocatelliglobosispora scoriae]|uniref:Molybdopterin converting factor small subunit n=1 Tax=Allocatelliglobosispora scoriae TaxID=643052 RepID=A0A841C1F5_9ACTN|nr:MoaD/ThiS family protein [Allocatelliglobosispora scoriae]MBB5872701.1 molybdopterin converting factor small subunit [Allocatelliglobosispora scoriae]
MVKIILPAGWTEGRRTVFESADGPLSDVIKAFAAAYPAYRHRVLGPDDEPLTYVNFCVDDDIVPRHLRATTVVEAGATITVMPPMAGG